jgi:solute:Na+ symporter, SSS family
VTFRVIAPFHGSEPAVFAKQTLATTLITTTVWMLITLLTPAEPDDTLVKFYRRVRPDASGWKPIAAIVKDLSPTKDLGRNLIDWIIGCTMVYAALFGVGKFCILEFWQGSVFVAVSISCAAFIYRSLNQAY